MARKKEPDLEIRNRDRIAQTAKALFTENGMEITTMNDIAKAVGMSKSTLYVYFKSKDEVRNYLSLEAMEYLYSTLVEQVKESLTVRERFDAICQVLVTFKERYPLNFQLLVEEICVDEQVLAQDAVLFKIYEMGEAVNQFLFRVMGSSMKAEDEADLFLRIFSMWGKLYGIITLADNKEAYIKLVSGMTKKEFLEKNFNMLYHSIELREE